MSIGETLASARQQAALSTTDVSHRTRIREGLIQDIENDDYSECGGDFYARGHIRSIAKAVGIDGEPLIREYDQVHRAPDAITDVMQLVATSRAAMAEEQAPESPAGPEELWEQPGEPAWEAHPAGPAGPAWQADPATPAWRADSAGPAEPAGPAWQEDPADPAGTAGAAWPADPAGTAGPAWPADAVGTADPAGPAWPADPVGTAGPARHAWPAGPGGHRRPRPALWLPQRRRLNWVAVVAVAFVIAAGVLGFELLTGSSQPSSPAAQGARANGSAGAPAKHGNGSPVPQHSHSAAATPTPTPTPTHTAPPAVTTRTLTPASAEAFGTAGAGQGDNAGLAPLAIDGSAGTAWHTDWYTSANFGNLYSGSGLLLNLGHSRTVTGARIRLGSTPGADFQLRVGSSPSLGALHPVAHENGASGMVHLHLASPAHGRYVLIWFTRLPDNGGTFQASVHDVKLTVRT